MKIDKMSEKISEEYKKQELNRQEFLTEIKKSTNHEKAYEFIEEFIQQINRSIMAENHILIEKLHEINQLLIELYNYTQSIENNDELAIARAEAQLQLIKEIIDKMEEI